jgi:hypothetical protein
MPKPINQPMNTPIKIPNANKIPSDIEVSGNGY